MSGIFINYRTNHARTVVGALKERLTGYFGAEHVFVDFQMRPATRYPDELYDRLIDSDVVVAVVHEGWPAGFHEPRRKDWVRFEIATAMAARIPVVPLLVESATPPRREELPDDIADFAALQVERVRGETLGTDIDRLVRLLEHHVAPAGAPPPVARGPVGPRRAGLRLAAWTTGVLLLSSYLLSASTGTTAPLWQKSASLAFSFAGLLTVVSVLTTLLTVVARPLSGRREAETATRTLREGTARTWLLLAAAALGSAFLLSRIGVGADGRWQEWELWAVLSLFVVALFGAHRIWRHYDALNRVWPPPVSTRPVDFRRAAGLLREKLTTDPDWRPPRSRVRQREAVALYLDLAEVRLDLLARLGKPLVPWIRAGYADEVLAYTGWLVGIVCLDAAAVALLLSSSAAEDTSVAGLPFGSVVGSTVALAVGFTATLVVTRFHADRRRVRRWAGELTEWQASVGPLIFCSRT